MAELNLRSFPKDKRQVFVYLGGYKIYLFWQVMHHTGDDASWDNADDTFPTMFTFFLPIKGIHTPCL